MDGVYLDGIEQAADASKVMHYGMPFVEAAGGAGLTLMELRGQADLAIAEQLFACPTRLDAWCGARGIRLGRDLHMTDDAAVFQVAGTTRGTTSHATRAEGATGSSPMNADMVLHEGKTFHQYTDHWDTPRRYTVAREALRSKPAVAEAARYYRVAFRDIARSNDERTMIAFMAPPGVVFGHTATVEKSPGARANAEALVMCALFNACTFDWLVRQKAAVHLSLYILRSLPLPPLTEAAERFLAHGALRLSCGHAGFASLWREQVGTSQAFPAMDDPAARWTLRAQMDAVVADAYGLDPVRYAHVLGSFNHKTCPAAAARCSAVLERLRHAGIEAFCRRHDPFAQVPLFEARASPVDAAVRPMLRPRVGEAVSTSIMTLSGIRPDEGQSG